MRTATVLFALATLITSRPAAQGAPAASDTVALEFRLADTAATAGSKEVAVEGERLFVQSKAEISNRDLADVRRVPSDSGLLLSLSFTPDGARRLARVTGANLGRRLATVVNGQVLGAPIILSEVKGQEGTVLSLQIPSNEADRLAAAVARTWPPGNPN